MFLPILKCMTNEKRETPKKYFLERELARNINLDEIINDFAL